MRTPSSRRRRRARRSTLLALAALCACLLLPATAAPAERKPKPLYWGALIGHQYTGKPAPWDFSAVEAFERKVRKGMSLLAFSSPFSDCFAKPCKFIPFPGEAMENLRQHGTIPFLSWATQSVPSKVRQPHYKLSQITTGRYDWYIRDFAEGARQWGHPFFLRFDAEMNGFWFPWGESVNGNKPGEFVKTWRHVHDIFEEEGATNATWVWCPNVDFTRRLTPLKGLYPGDSYVDWTCLDGFNWGDTSNSAGWQSFDEIFRSTYQRVVKIAPDKPMVVGETASEERGGSKPKWIRHTLGTIPKKYPKIRAVLWFDEKDQGMHWPVTSTKQSKNAFASAIRRSVYRPNVFSELPPGRIQPPGPHLAATPAP